MSATAYYVDRTTTIRDASVAIPTTCEHTRPFPWNPDLQVHVAFVAVFVHNALASQPPLFVAQ